MSSPQLTSVIPYIHILLTRDFYVVLPAVLICYILYQHLFHPLARIPGPFLASLTNWWYVRATRTETWHRIVVSLHEKYGPIVRIAPNQVSVGAPKAVRQIYPVSSTAFPKSDWYSVFRGTRRVDLFAGQDQWAHGRHRKMVVRAYAMDTLKDLEPYVDYCLELLVEQLDGRVGQKVDMAKRVHLFSFDVIGEITWSANFGFLTAGVDDGTFETIRTMGRSGSWLGHVPYVFRMHELLKPYIGNWLDRPAIRKSRGKKDLINRFFDAHEKNPEEFTYTDVISMGATQVSAGSDTTAVSIRAIIYYVLRNPSVKAKLVAEIDEARRKGELSNPIKHEEAAKLKYLQAVVSESLRVHPAMAVNLPRVVPSGGANIEGHYLPGGTVVGMSAWVVHKDKEVYGEDAHAFRPERWLERDTTDMNRCLLTFGAGSRACLGRNMAAQQMSKVIPTLFLNYDMELADPEKGWRIECLLFVAQYDMDVAIERRQDYPS
ncbi:cytochrome P450 oxidoreductase [Paraphaeosphaeria minitans]|uniref:Cytochrome P450 oxidoreductase n=1 Tax=Paraphaeosphaeria minitans TaxID=565426 RepID=A0A9P6GTS2_9PLEO|nr:cytochrome P450 oxidoreductase [Paraphaeosphaeria minitans]